MPNPRGSYYYSSLTLTKAKEYLKKLKLDPQAAGGGLKEIYQGNFQELSPEELIALLMNTRKPQCYAESGTFLNGLDWNADETSILGDISFVTFGTKAYNNGGHDEFVNHSQPLPVNLIYASASLLRNDHWQFTADMEEVLVGSQVNEARLYSLYERRLLPGLLAQNQQAQLDDEWLIINIPGMGCGQFAGQYEAQVRRLLPKVLKKLFSNHQEQLDRVRTVNYDPYEETHIDAEDKIDTEKFRMRPYKALNKDQRASQLEYPKDLLIDANTRLVKIVAWDHFSYPGNDMWADSRGTDDGVAFASTDTFLAMKNLGQFRNVSQQAVIDFSYNPSNGEVLAMSQPFSALAGFLQSSVLPEHMKLQVFLPTNPQSKLVGDGKSATVARWSDPIIPFLGGRGPSTSVLSYQSSVASSSSSRFFVGRDGCKSVRELLDEMIANTQQMGARHAHQTKVHINGGTCAYQAIQIPGLRNELNEKLSDTIEWLNVEKFKDLVKEYCDSGRGQIGARTQLDIKADMFKLIKPLDNPSSLAFSSDSDDENDSNSLERYFHEDPGLGSSSSSSSSQPELRVVYAERVVYPKEYHQLGEKLKKLQPSLSQETIRVADSVFRQFREMLNSSHNRLEDFEHALEDHRPALQFDLSVWDCFVNFLKRIANALISIVTCTYSSNFFQPAKTPVFEAFEEFTLQVK